MIRHLGTVALGALGTTLADASRPTSFTSGPWFVVAAAMVFFILGAILAVVCFNWGASNERKIQFARDEADLADLRPAFFEPNPAGEHPVWNPPDSFNCSLGANCGSTTCRFQHPPGGSRGRPEAPTVVEPSPYTGALPEGATPPADALSRWFKNVPAAGTYTEIPYPRVVFGPEVVVGMELADDHNSVPFSSVPEMEAARFVRWSQVTPETVEHVNNRSNRWTWPPGRTFVVRGGP